MSTCVTPSFIGIQTSTEITSRKAHTLSYPLSSFVVQNTGSTQETHKPPQILPFTKMTERIEYNTILEGTDDEGAIHLFINFKCTVIVADPISPIRNMPHSTRLVFCETNVRYYQ